MLGFLWTTIRFSIAFVWRILNTIRIWLLNIVILAILFSVLFEWDNEQVSVPAQASLVLQLNGSLVEQLAQPTLQTALIAPPKTKQLLLQDVVRIIDAAAEDDRIRMLRLDLSELSAAPLAHLRTVRQALLRFKHKKPILAIAPAYTQTQYYLASVANEIIMHPLGTVDLTGFAMYRSYMRDALDSLKLDVHLFRTGAYKSAAAPYIRNQMSDAEKQVSHVWLDALWKVFLQDIAQARHIQAAQVQAFLDHPEVLLARYHGDQAAIWKALGLIDRIADVGMIANHSVTLSGADDLQEINARSYVTQLPETAETQQPAVAVIIASGPILYGEQASGSIGSTSLIRLIEQAQQDQRVRSLVLRINSPGGSALASDLIRDALMRFKASGKTLTVSMGSMAASGGYWIATAADRIWAQESSITGSIGVFGLLPNAARSLEAIGIHNDGIASSALAGGMRIDRPLAAASEAMIQSSIQFVFQRFMQHIHRARGIPMPQLKILAQGQVWTGAQAKELALLDALGGLDQAVRASALAAGIGADYQVLRIRPAKHWLDEVFAQLVEKTEVAAYLPKIQSASILAQWWTQWSKPLQLLNQLNDPKHVYVYSDIAYQ